MRIRIGFVALVMLSSCGGDVATDAEPAAEPTTAPSSTEVAVAESTESPAPSVSTGGAPLSLPAYLAATYRSNAGAVRDQSDLAASGAAPPAYLEVWAGIADNFDSLVPPPEAVDLHSAYVGMASTYVGVFERFIAKLEEPNADRDLAVAIFLQDVGELGQSAAEIDAATAKLALDVLASTSDDPVAMYAAEVIALQTESGEAVGQAFAALGNLGFDPEAALGQLFAAYEALGPISETWATMMPPSDLQDLHSAQVTGLDRMIELMAQLQESFEAGEEPDPLLVAELNQWSLESQELNARWSTFFAEVFERLE